MRIGEVIERLQELAEQLPDGLDSGVRIKICNTESSPSIITSAIEVDSITEFAPDMQHINSAYAAIIGHPHLAVSTAHSVTSGLEDAVRDWTGDPAAAPAEPGPASQALQVVGNPAAFERITIEQPAGGGYRMELTPEGKLRYPPGHPDSLRAGCLCDPEKNHHGLGAQAPDAPGTFFIMKRFCPLHEHTNGSE